jgi:transposase
MTHSPRRHDLSDEVWELLEAHLPGRQGVGGGMAGGNRQFINAAFWIMRTDALCRDLPPDYGDWSNTHRRFIRWRDKGIWEKLLEALIDDPDYEWLMIGARSGNQDMSRAKGGSTPGYIWPWMRMVCRSEFLSHKVPQRIVRRLIA